MLILLISTAWLATLVLMLCICRVIADAEADPPAVAAANADIGQRIVLLRTPLAPAYGSRRPDVHRPVSRAARPSRRRVGAH